MNEVLPSLRLEKHLDKTFVGEIEKGFDFIGYRFGSRVRVLPEATIERFFHQAIQLYEQGRTERIKAPLLGSARRWLGWASGGLAGFSGGVQRQPTPYQYTLTFPRANPHRVRVA